MRLSNNKGFTLIELLIVVAIIGIIAAFAVPNLLRARMAGNETSAIASMRAINSAEATYATACGNNGYAVALTVLGTPPPGGGQAFLSPDLTAAPTVNKSGYQVTLAAGTGAVAGVNDCNGTATQSAWFASAAPMTPGTSGNRYFGVNTNGTIYQDSAAAVTNTNPPSGAPIQ